MFVQILRDMTKSIRLFLYSTIRPLPTLHAVSIPIVDPTLYLLQGSSAVFQIVRYVIQIGQTAEIPDSVPVSSGQSGQALAGAVVVVIIVDVVILGGSDHCR